MIAGLLEQVAQEYRKSNDLELEMDAIPDLRAAIAYCEAHKDYVTRDLFDAILRSEEEHVDWLETQLSLIDSMGVENYLQAKMG